MAPLIFISASVPDYLLQVDMSIGLWSNELSTTLFVTGV